MLMSPGPTVQGHVLGRRPPDGFTITIITLITIITIIIIIITIIITIIIIIIIITIITIISIIITIIIIIITTIITTTTITTTTTTTVLGCGCTRDSKRLHQQQAEPAAHRKLHQQLIGSCTSSSEDHTGGMRSPRIYYY